MYMSLCTLYRIAKRSPLRKVSDEYLEKLPNQTRNFDIKKKKSNNRHHRLKTSKTLMIEQETFHTPLK